MTNPKSRALLCAFVCVVLLGCQPEKPTTQPASAYDRSENALRHPFDYSPYDRKPDMSGGGVHPEQNSLKKDLDDVFNP